MATDLSSYNNSWYQPGSFLKRITWHYISCIFFKSGYFPVFRLKVFLLKLFGARVGVGLVMKPFVSIKYPWLLTIGNHVWIGENVSIDNIAHVRIGDHACVSQGACLLTGNHNYKKNTFDLLPGEIILEQGVWIGARAIVCPGVTCKDHSILSVGSVATKDMEPFYIYTGNPATKVRGRTMDSESA